MGFWGSDDDRVRNEPKHKVPKGFAMRRSGPGVLAFLLISLLLGCSSVAYRRIDKYHQLGFSERKIGNGLYYVWAVTDHDSVRYIYDKEFKLRRTAELTLESGFRYFVILTKKNHEQLFSDVDPAQLRLVFSGHIFRFLSSPEGVADSIDAVVAIRETDAATKGRLSQKARRALVRFTK